MWWRADAPSLGRAVDRVSTIYVDQAAVGRENNTIAVFDIDGEVRLPAAMVGSLLLGPGTRITHGAMRLLADSGTSVCWVGENGVRMYASGVATARSSRVLLRQAWLASDPRRRTGIARRMYEMRFPGEDVSGLTLPQLRGREGARVRRAYRLHSSRTGVPWEGRKYIPGQAYAAGDDVNRMLSACNACLYGLAHAAICALGASPGLGFVHTGSTISFVLDIADLYKAVTSIPTAFDLVAEGLVDERSARLRVRDLIVNERLMDRIVRDLRSLLLDETPGADESDDGPLGTDDLWDEDGTVPGGRGYAGPAVEW